MRQLVLLIFLISFFQLGNAQEKSFRKNTILLESGIFSRGWLGLSYARKFLVHDKIFLGSDIFAGIGGSGNYYGLGLNLNVGKPGAYFVFGLDAKHFEVSWNESLLLKAYYFSGIAYNPYIGFSVFGKKGGTIKLRMGFMPMYENKEFDNIFLSVGIAFGFSF